MTIKIINDDTIHSLTNAFKRELLLHNVGYKEMELRLNRNNELVFFISTPQGKSFLWRWHKRLSMGKSIMDVVKEIVYPALYVLK